MLRGRQSTAAVSGWVLDAAPGTSNAVKPEWSAGALRSQNAPVAVLSALVQRYVELLPGY